MVWRYSCCNFFFKKKKKKTTFEVLSRQVFRSFIANLECPVLVTSEAIFYFMTGKEVHSFRDEVGMFYVPKGFFVHQ